MAPFETEFEPVRRREKGVRMAPALLAIPLLALPMLLVPASGLAQDCDPAALPQSVRSVLEKSYSKWKIVTPELLSSNDDRKRWTRNHGGQCPGFVLGYFSGDDTGYAVNLVRARSGVTEQQVVYFRPSKKGFESAVLVPPSRVDVVKVLRRFGPGDYRSAGSERAISIELDAIGVSKLQGGTVLYYWSAGKFRSIATSE